MAQGEKKWEKLLGDNKAVVDLCVKYVYEVNFAAATVVPFSVELKNKLYEWVPKYRSRFQSPSASMACKGQEVIATVLLVDNLAKFKFPDR